LLQFFLLRDRRRRRRYRTRRPRRRRSCRLAGGFSTFDQLSTRLDRVGVRRRRRTRLRPSSSAGRGCVPSRRTRSARPWSVSALVGVVDVRQLSEVFVTSSWSLSSTRPGWPAVGTAQNATSAPRLRGTSHHRRRTVTVLLSFGLARAVAQLQAISRAGSPCPRSDRSAACRRRGARP